jgi:hypothetical protein
MNNIVRGLTYAFKRNIGWQDRTIRTILGLVAIAGIIYFFKSNLLLSLLFVVLAIAQIWTVLSAKCIICYFMGKCTIGNNEKAKLNKKGLDFKNR